MSRFFIPVFLIIMFLMSCGDDGSSARSYEQAFETSSSLRDDNKLLVSGENFQNV